VCKLYQRRRARAQIDLSLMRTENREDLGMQQPAIEILDLFVVHVPGPCCRTLVWTLETQVLPLIVGRWKSFMQSAVYGHFNGLLDVALHLNATGAVGRSSLSS
jgi:hypothetical protein